MNRVLLGMVLLAVAAPAAMSQTTQPSRAVATDDEDVVYRPPSQGASRARMGGGSRTGVKLPAIEALVPDHAGITLSPRPVLYWYCDESTELPREFSLVDANTLETVTRQKMAGRIEKGWQKIDLGEIGVELSPEVPYEWRIAIVAGTGKASDNAVAGGMIQLARKPQIADAALHPPLKRAAQLAAAGVWYDALAEVMVEVQKDAGNAAAKRALSRLLDQVKLKAATAYAPG